MTILLKIRREVADLSKWFKISLIFIFILYISFWIFTIHLHNVQKVKQFEPVLPIAPEDSDGYRDLSESILSGHGLSQNGKIETLRTPGYPLFTAAIKGIFGSYFAVTLVQIFLVFLSAFIIRRIGIFFNSKKVGEISAFLFLINPVTLTLALIVLTDTLFLFLFVLGFYLALSLKREKIIPQILIMSVVYSFAIYIRLGLFIIPTLAAPILASTLDFKFKLKSILAVAVVITIFTIPWIVRNYVETGVAGFTSFRAVNMAWVIPKWLSQVDNIPEAEEQIKYTNEIGVEASTNWQDIRYSDRIISVSNKIILQRPFSYLKYHIITSVPFLFPSSVAFTRDVYNSVMHQKTPFSLGAINSLTTGDWRSFFQSILKVWWKVLERLCWLLVYVVASFGLWQNRKNKLTWAFVFVAAYFMLLSGPAAGPRYSFQAWPFIFILFSAGFVYLQQKFLDFRSSKTA